MNLFRGLFDSAHPRVLPGLKPEAVILRCRSALAAAWCAIVAHERIMPLPSFSAKPRLKQAFRQQGSGMTIAQATSACWAWPGAVRWEVLR